jgi:hypothetical protein
MNILPEVLFRPNPLVINGFVLELLDYHPNDLGPVELVAGRSAGVIAQVVEKPEMPWGEHELDAVFGRLRFGLRDGPLTCCLWLLHLLGPAEDIIPASGERILA